MLNVSRDGWKGDLNICDISVLLISEKSCEKIKNKRLSLPLIQTINEKQIGQELNGQGVLWSSLWVLTLPKGVLATTTWEGLTMNKKTGLKGLQCVVSGKLVCKLVLDCFVFCIVLTLASAALAGEPPLGWHQVNDDGFIAGRAPSDWGTNLFAFNGALFAFDGDSVFRMQDPTTRDWAKLTISAPPAGPGPNATFKPFGNYVYACHNNQLWFLQKGIGVWNKVTSVTSYGDVSPYLMAVFNGRLYGKYYTSSGTFEIWRTSNIGSTVAYWEQVVINSFGDPTNNQSVDEMIVYAGKIYAAVGTLGGGSFGDPNIYGTGVEVWQSPTGNYGSWSQVNVDGFGTLFSGCFSGVCNFPIHQVVGSMAVYQAKSQTQAYLYVGTLSHFGAEIWRYDGTGLGGWTNVTPPWAGPCLFGCGPGRNNDMAVFKGELYLAEGFPTANLAKYDGATWSVLVAGPDPFDPDYNRLEDLAVLGDKLYVTSAGYSFSGRGDQVWGFPFVVGYDRCFESLSGKLLHGFDMVDSLWFMGETATYLGINAGGPLLGWIDGNNFAFYYDAPTGALGEEGAFHFGHISDLTYNLTTTSGSFFTGGVLTPCNWAAQAIVKSSETGDGSLSAGGSPVCFEDGFGYRHTISSDGYHLYGYTDNTECGSLLPLVGVREGDVFSFYVDVPTGDPVCNVEGIMYQGRVSTLNGVWRRTPMGGIDHGTFHLVPCSTTAEVD